MPAAAAAGSPRHADPLGQERWRPAEREQDCGWARVIDGDVEWLGRLQGWRGGHHGGCWVVQDSQQQDRLVPPEQLFRVQWAEPPPGWAVGPDGRTHLGAGDEGGNAVFRDVDGNEIRWELLTRGYARYARNGEWREPVCSVDWHLRGRPGCEVPHIRCEVADAIRVIKLPGESIDATEALRALLDRGHVRHSRSRFEQGCPVLLQRATTIDGVEGVMEVAAGEKGVVLSDARDRERDDDPYEIVIPSGDRFDVSPIDLVPCPPVQKGALAELRRLVTFQSGRAPVPPGTVAKVVGLAEKTAEVSAVDPKTGKEFTFDVNQLWLRPQEGPQVRIQDLVES